jgi:phosphosulfolactate synthase
VFLALQFIIEHPVIFKEVGIMKRAFSTIDIPTRPPKPRDAGVSMMIDWGLPPGAQRDILGFAAEFIDLAKVAVGISGLIAEDALTNKISVYREAGVEPFPGGMFLELAFKQEKVEDYYAECQEYGLQVLGEVGSKHEKTDLPTLITDIQAALQAGAWKVFVEAAEFVSPEGLNTSLIETLLGEVNPADIIFELPGKWIPNVQAHQIYRLMVWLVEHVGPTVNIGNVAPEDVLPLETLRTGVGVNMKL